MLRHKQLSITSGQSQTVSITAEEKKYPLTHCHQLQRSEISECLLWHKEWWPISQQPLLASKREFIIGSSLFLSNSTVLTLSDLSTEQ
jgi:hypothetical protein